MKQWVLASNNPGKVREFNALFSDISLVAQEKLGVTECAEPYFTFLENALAKARHASEHTGQPALADDSGICATALNGAPGVLSARFAGEPKSDRANNQKLVQALSHHSDHSVVYVCVLVFVRHAADPIPVVAQGTWAGQFINTPSGENGFGYDPHFFLPEEGVTAAQLAPERKNQISHRAQAMRTLLAMLKKDWP